MGEKCATRTVVSSTAIGALVGAAAWVAIVPWDLSTHLGSQPIPGALDQDGQLRRLAAAFVLPCVVAVLAGAAHLIRPLAFSVAAGAIWIALTTWRAMDAEVQGANMAALWPIVGLPAVMVSAAVVVTITSVIEQLRQRRQRSRPG